MKADIPSVRSFDLSLWSISVESYFYKVKKDTSETRLYWWNASCVTIIIKTSLESWEKQKTIAKLQTDTLKQKAYDNYRSINVN